MVTSGGILSTERLSYTAHDSPLYHNHEWLTQLLFLALYSLGGPYLLALVGALLAVATVIGAGGWSRARRRRGSSASRYC